MSYTNKILVIDLEATCWQGAIPHNQRSEIIEIGVCLLDTETGAITANKGILVQPEVSEVSKFCMELTTITQTLLDKEGISFTEACNQLVETYNPYQLTWESYGDYDRKMIQLECKHKSVDYPFSQDHINVKELFARLKNGGKKVGMNGALQLLSIALEGTHHRGVDDAKNIAKILYRCLSD